MQKKSQTIIAQPRISFLIERMAYWIGEKHTQTDTLLLVGIGNTGMILSQKLQQLLQTILPNLKVDVAQLSINKSQPFSSEITIFPTIDSNFSKPIILVDDVINSGKTLFYCLKPFFEFPNLNLQTLVLIERKHKKYPVSADFVGVSFNTTFSEHIEVVVENGEISSVILN